MKLNEFSTPLRAKSYQFHTEWKIVDTEYVVELFKERFHFTLLINHFSLITLPKLGVHSRVTFGAHEFSMHSSL